MTTSVSVILKLELVSRAIINLNSLEPARPALPLKVSKVLLVSAQSKSEKSDCSWIRLKITTLKVPSVFSTA
jgi:hypothetical protein